MTVPAWMVDPIMIRSLLGPLEQAWTDDQLRSAPVVEPVIREMLVHCPDLSSIVDEDQRRTVSLAMSNMIVANIVQNLIPRLTTSRLGDSTMVFPAGHEDERADRLRETAWSLLQGICQARPRVEPIRMFRVAQGRRGE